MKGFNRRVLAILVIVVFAAAWFSYAFYLYSNQILVVRVEGSIVNFEETSLALHRARVDSRVKAVVIYLNTPGGLAYSCLEIAKHVEGVAEVKPVVAVMGPYCASGGYVIASYATHILTHENTITGGIGVIAVWVDLSEHYEKEGIKIWVWSTGLEKEFGAEWRSPTPEERERIQGEVDSLAQLISSIIEENRPISPEDMSEVSTGMTYSGSQAVEIGLADGIGDLINALEKAGSLTGAWRHITVTPEMSGRERFLEALL